MRLQFADRCRPHVFPWHCGRCDDRRMISQRGHHAPMGIVATNRDTRRSSKKRRRERSGSSGSASWAAPLRAISLRPAGASSASTHAARRQEPAKAGVEIPPRRQGASPREAPIIITSLPSPAALDMTVDGDHRGRRAAAHRDRGRNLLARRQAQGRQTLPPRPATSRSTVRSAAPARRRGSRTSSSMRAATPRRSPGFARCSPPSPAGSTISATTATAAA